jgi:hypothetical protein
MSASRHLAEAKAAINSPPVAANGNGGGCGNGHGDTSQRDDLLAKIAARTGS